MKSKSFSRRAALALAIIITMGSVMVGQGVQSHAIRFSCGGTPAGA